MKKILTFMVIALFAVSIPLSAHAGAINAMEGKVAALLGDKAVQQTYNYNTIFAYSDNTDYWWTGLVIFNISKGDLFFTRNYYSNYLTRSFIPASYLLFTKIFQFLFSKFDKL